MAPGLAGAPRRREVEATRAGRLARAREEVGSPVAREIRGEDRVRGAAGDRDRVRRLDRAVAVRAMPLEIALAKREHVLPTIRVDVADRKP